MRGFHDYGSKVSITCAAQTKPAVQDFESSVCAVVMCRCPINSNLEYFIYYVRKSLWWLQEIRNKNIPKMIVADTVECAVCSQKVPPFTFGTPSILINTFFQGCSRFYLN